MDGFMLISIIIVSVVIVLAKAVIWGGIGWLGVRATKSMSRSGGVAGSGLPPTGFDRDCAEAMRQLPASMKQAQAAQSQIGTPSGGTLVAPHHFQQQFKAQIVQVQRQLRDMNHLSDERLFASELQGRGTEARLDVRGGKMGP